MYQEDELEKYLEKDIIRSFDDFTEARCPPNYQFSKRDDCVIYYQLVFDEVTSFPKVFASIRIDHEFHVQLQCNGNHLPLPLWFIRGTDAKIRRFSQLENFPKEFENAVENDSYEMLEELEKRRYFKPKGRPPYSVAVIRYALLLRYTSLQAYKLLLQKFSPPSISLLNKLQAGGLDAVKSVKYLLEKGEISRDIVLMFDEMYLQKCTQYHGGIYEGANEDGELYKGVVVFMITGLKKSIPYVIKACPETSIKGKWLAEHVEGAIVSLSEVGFIVKGIVADNHSANVCAFNSLLDKFPGDTSRLFMLHPDNKSRIYMFYDNVHLLKNIRNNLFNVKRFVFPELEILLNDEIRISIPNGYISWSDIHFVYDEDCKLPANLRKAPKLTYRALHPGNNQQNVNLALGIFHKARSPVFRATFLKERIWLDL